MPVKSAHNTETALLKMLYLIAIDRQQWVCSLKNALFNCN